ncbi:gene transfer agent family protein [Paracoccus homiensis]|nr:gene transfer agent family protein [Paracoccus homiensis]
MDIGEGRERRLFLGVDELRQIKKETGRGFFALFSQFHLNAEPDEVQAVIRLALIGGGMSPSEAEDIATYYATPPRPMRKAYEAAHKVLSAIWNGIDPQDGAKDGERVSDDQMDRLIDRILGSALKNGASIDTRNLSIADLLSLVRAANDDPDDKPAAPVDLFMKLHGSK